MSVTFAPRARMAVNASWPGVSRNVIFRPLTSTWYAPMCCVIPPASVATTRVLRMASSSVVLPWSTWPMIVTTGGRVTSASSGSSYASGSSSSSPACLIVTSRSSSVAISSTSSSVSDWVAVRIWPRLMRILIRFGIGTPSACDRSRTVTPDSTETGPEGCAGVVGRASRRVPSCWPPRAWRGSCRGRAAWLSMTTRRLRLPGPAPPRGRSGRFGFPPFAISLQCKGAQAPDRPSRPAVTRAQSPSAAGPARSSRGAGRCTRLVPVSRAILPPAPGRDLRHGP